MKFSVFERHDSFSRQLKSELITTITTGMRWEYDPENPELVICVGGDGTLLRAIHTYEESLDSILFTAIHTGTLGFFTDYTRDEIDAFLGDLESGKPEVESYPLLEAKLDSGEVYHALNEIRVGSFANTVHYDILIDGEFFERISSCGICVSTQAGSTGANRALEGAVVENGLNILEMTQIMPVSHVNSHSLISPYIMKPERVIELRGESIKDSVLCHDHLETGKLTETRSIIIRSSGQHVRFARFHPYSYLKRLRNLF